ncbi:hypothetical protein [Leptospira bandrabouensis]|uniref:hypothetical protein n=1 Tax=Leptospira bandrabouensis TaxID=2484903 RepID=UPI001EE8676A|nr:hypothetical protein [Leptospira bandrabouensis]MCG6161161.1 hypothetical protein [Leptospira bandrabouensis]MCG6164715.1 hypothetical protein [Leptospira bandrabouensis]
MSPLFSNFPSLSPFLSLGKQIPEKKGSIFQRDRSFPNPTEKSNLPLKGNSFPTSLSHQKTPNINVAIGSDTQTHLGVRKAENRFRWSQWISTQSESKTFEVSELKPIWNYLLGETGFTDLLSFLDPEANEFLQMVVEPKNKGLVLYVFWESKETGAMGIQFHYDPEKEKPVIVHITTETSLENESIRKSLLGLVRDFPQIQSVQIETWNEDAFNGDYR